ncbi:hypothetical protein RF683_01025 [Flavobacterium sp. 20NA77.7]|uniref:ATP synthase protein I n=1 Tax=Flavobacterium nakdongensis TaxID=3073563 RepID=A0ABY9RD35_9FLAO|nr:hypothetical protein [Flavobacterium sp. 20NA77.7]WMW78056.1 hypothetical protein RF683_01025 [Flavobacterium sp. 20NA77.7]
MKLLKSVLWLTCMFVVLLLFSWIGSYCFLNQTSFVQMSQVCMGNYAVSLVYLFLHTYFYKTKPYAFGFIAMITLTIKFVLAYAIIRLISNSLQDQLFLKFIYFIVFAVFMIADVVYSAILLNSTKK